jgi:hypothetical protein
MKTWIFIIFAALLFSGLTGCYYSDTDIFYVEPIADDPPLLSVSTNLDTLHDPQVNDSLEVNYLVDISGGEFYYVYADVAGSIVFESDSTEGSFWITSLMADSSGIDTLHMEFYYSTNTNSLADMFGYEALAEYLNFALDFNLGGSK